MTESKAYPTGVHPDIASEHEYEWEKNLHINPQMEDSIGFMRKVFGILSIQMLVTFTFALGGAVLKKSMGHFFRHPAVILISLLGVIGFSLWLFLSKDTRKSVPGNYIILGLFTLCEGMLFAGLTSRMETQAVLSAIMALAVICTTLYIVVYMCQDCVMFHRAVAKGMGIAIVVQLGLICLMVFMGLFKFKGQ